MNAVAVVSSVVGLATVAVAGVAAGYLRDAPAPVEPPADPLEDVRASMLRSLADLEEARAMGALEDEAYERLRGRSEARLARVLRAIERRRAGPTMEPSGEGRDDRRADAPAEAAGDQRRVPRWAVSVLLAGVVLAAVTVSLTRDARPQAEGPSAPQAADDALAFFERRVRDHPEDVAARLDLAHRYLDAGRIEESLAEYSVALELDPDDAEAHAHVGMILYLSGRPQEGLEAVDRALEADPRYPEALFVRGIILLRGLERPQEAIAAFERYLEAAPFGAERGSARDLIDEAGEALAGS